MTRPAYTALLRRLGADVDALTAEVVRDVAVAGEEHAAVAATVRPVVVWTLDSLSDAEQLPPERVDALQNEGRRAAQAGESLQRLLDRYLSTGWVVWGAATRIAEDDDAAALPALGTALLKAGDAAAAAIASGTSSASEAPLSPEASTVT